MDWSFRRNFLWVSSPGLHTLSREKFVSFSHKYQEELNSECFLNFSTRSSLIRHLRQPLHHDPAAFSRAILGGKCAQAGIEQDRFGLVENTVPFNIRKFRKFKPGFLVKWNVPLVLLLFQLLLEECQSVRQQNGIDFCLMSSHGNRLRYPYRPLCIFYGA